MRSRTSELRGVKEIPGASAVRRSAAVLLATGIGVAEMCGAYWEFHARIPGEVTSHYSLNGTPNGSLSPVAFLASGVALEVGLAAFLVSFLVLAARAAVVERFYGPLSWYLPVGWSVVVLGLTVPAQWVVLYASAAGAIAPGADQFALLAWLGGIVPLLVLLLIVVQILRRVRPQRVLTEARTGSTASAFCQFRCTSCGTPFQEASVSLFTPHLPASGESGALSLLYTRCPQCGERGWNLYFGRTTMSPAAAPLPTH